jgi:hypothetical protein
MPRRPARGRHRNRNPLARERMRSRSHREFGGALCRPGHRADDGGKRAGGVSDPLCHPPEAAPGPFRRGSLTPPLVRTKVTARRAHERSRSSRKNECVIVFAVWTDLAESESAESDVQHRAESIADRIDARPTDEHRREDARVRLCPEGVVFALTDAASFPGNSAARAIPR